MFGAKEYALNENTEEGNIPPGGAEVNHNGKTCTMRFKVDFTALIRRLVFLLVPHCIFKLINILCQKIKRISSVRDDKCDTDLPDNDCSDQDTINSAENRTFKLVRTKLVQRQSFAYRVRDKHKNLVTGNSRSKLAPRQNAPGGPAVRVE